MTVRTAAPPNAGPLAQPSRRWRKWAPRPATIAVGSLVVLPLLAYALPALLGHVVVPGDDLTQSLPLRELVGRDIAAGHLPIFDPYLWSGTPLLAGWNAGAAYPLSWLFSVLPATAAWTITLVSAVVAAGVGCYAFLRANRLGVVASWLGAATFAFGGGMSAQLSHIGLVVGMSWVPLGLLAILHLTSHRSDAGGRGTASAGRRRGGPEGLASAAGWTAALAGSVALVVLAGEPRAVADAATVFVLYGAWRLSRLAMATRRRGAPASATGWAALAVLGGGVLGVGLGAVQLLPGLAAVATSQRAVVTSFLFSAGSLPAPWLLLLGIPDLLGGSGSFGQRTFFASYNLTEVTGYVGMLPLVAVGALLGRLRLRHPVPEWVVWYAVAAAGVLLALGSHTPLWHLLIRIPLFGGQRLQSRSILVTGLALAVLLAYWADGWLAGEAGAVGAAGTEAGAVGAAVERRQEEPGRLRRRERLLGAAVPACMAVVGVVALAWPVQLDQWMGVARGAAADGVGLRPWLVPFLALAVAATAVAWAGGPHRMGRGSGRQPPAVGRRRGSGRWLRPAVLVAFVVVDLAAFAVTTVLAVGAGAPARSAPAPTSAAKGASHHREGRRTSPGAVRPIATLHLGGRSAVYDPTLRDTAELAPLGVPDANVLTGTPSVGGYGSIVDGNYARATGTHGVSGTGQDVFAPRAADDGVLDSLDTTAVLVPSSYLVSAPARGAPARGARGAPAGRDDGRRAASGQPATWELGTPLAVASLTVGMRPATALEGATPARPPASASAGGSVRIGLVRSDGTVVWSDRVTVAHDTATRRTTWRTTWRATWPVPVHAVAVMVATSRRATLEAPVLTTAGGSRLSPSGPLDAALVPPHWRYAGRDGAFAVYRNTRARPPLTLRPLRGGTLTGASVSRLSGPALDPSAARVSSPHGVSVVRAVADIPGWSATWTPAGTAGARRRIHLAVRRDGVVQLVRVPAGRGTLAWDYRAPDLLVGAVSSVVALACLLGLAAVALVATLAPWSRRGRAGRLPHRSSVGARAAARTDFLELDRDG